MKKGEKLQEMEKALTSLERELAENRQIVDDMLRRRKKIDHELKQLRQNLSQQKPSKIHVSDHALLRYAERRHGVPVEAYRREILNEFESAENIGSLKFAGFVIRNNTVVTFTDGPDSPKV